MTDVRRRSNPAGSPWASTPSAKRKRPMLNLTLPRELIEAIDEARGAESRSMWIEEAAKQRLSEGKSSP